VGVSGDGPRFTGYDAHWLLRKYIIEEEDIASNDMVTRAL
jgi:hypothetical protein